MGRSRVPHSMTVTLGLAFAALVLALAMPARAQEDRHGPPDDHGRYEQEHHDRGWERRHRRPPPVYAAPVYAAPVYAPPAVVYTPPVPLGGITLIIPFNFH
jgi:hypothetical protein